MARSSRIAASVAARARKVRLLLVDVDGVLTDGRIYLLSRPDGTALEMKAFSAYDGAGLKLARVAGLRTGLITGRESAATSRRARELDMEFVYQGIADKIVTFRKLVQRAGVEVSEIAYVGDDLPDLPILERVGLAIAVANAVPEVKRQAHYVTRATGGNGAVREVVELILKAQGKWANLLSKARA
ncbi:MAG: HAD hydrolase family protein [Acidipila sp.]|nr:HAD hydrolase family protein [Acidipila sp.]